MMDDSCAPSIQEASSSEELTGHQREQKEEELFIQSGKLKTDNMSQSGKNLFVCTHCDNAFSRAGLKRHKHLLAAETLLLNTLGKRAVSASSKVKRHTLFHSEGKSFVCNQCDKAFSWACHLKTHILSHTGEKLFVCNQCDKALSQASHLKTQMLSHTGEKMFVCNQCDKVFS